MTSGRQYAQLRIDIWRDDDWCRLSTDAQWLYELLISQPVTSSCGVLPLQITKWARCSGDMTVERVAAALGDLSERRYIVIDDVTEEVLVRSYIRHGVMPTGTPNVMLSALRCAVAVQSLTLRQALLHEIRRLDKDWPDKAANEIKRLEESLGDALPKPSGSHPKGSVKVQVVVTEKQPPKQSSVPVVTKSGTALESVEARRLVQENVPRHLLSAPRQRSQLNEQVQEMLEGGSDPRGIALALKEWCARPDAYAGHLPHIYTELLKRQSNARNVRELKGADRSAMEWERYRE